MLFKDLIKLNLTILPYSNVAFQLKIPETSDMYQVVQGL